MKRCTLLAALTFALAFTATAQESETIFSGDVSHGGFGALVYGGTEVNGQFTYLQGIRGAWVIRFGSGQALNLGLARYETENAFDPADWRVADVSRPEMRTEYSGFEVEYVNRSSKLLHFSVQVLIGSGDVEYEEELFPIDNSDAYFVLQPGVNMTLNVTDWFRLSGGVFYRHASGVDLHGTSNKELSGFTTFAALRFGWF